MTRHTVRWAVASSLLVGFCLSWPSWVGPRASERDGLGRDRVQTEAEAAAIRREFYDRGGTPNPQLDRQILPLKAMADESFLVSLSDTIQDGLERADFPRVIVIGIDGMGADNVWRDTYRDVPPPAIPNINQLKDTGAYSLGAKIDPLNFSGPN